MNANENVNVEEVVQTLRNYFKIYENANVQASTELRIKVIMELFEYILGDINCRMYLLDPAKHILFTIMEKKVAELMSNPKAQANNRFMVVCQELDVFLQNGRILKAEQVAQVPPVPVPIVMNYADNAHVADLHAEQDQHDANLREWYDDDDEDDRVSVDTWISEHDNDHYRGVLNDYFGKIIEVEDINEKVDLAMELFGWINESPDVQHNLLAPENEDLFNHLNGLIDELADDQLLSNQVDSNEIYREATAEIKLFVERGQILAPPEQFNRNIMDNYIISIINVEDDEMKVSIAFELFEWICENDLVRQALFAPENKDLFDDLYWVLEEMTHSPTYSAAMEANNYYRILDGEIKTIVENLERVLSEREDEAECVDEAECCRRCDKPLFDDEGAYCLDCELDKIDDELS
jgi:hypothetical protein